MHRTYLTSPAIIRIYIIYTHFNYRFVLLLGSGWVTATYATAHYSGVGNDSISFCWEDGILFITDDSDAHRHNRLIGDTPTPAAAATQKN